MHYLKLYTSKWFTAADLPAGETLDVTITKVTIERVQNKSGEEERPAIHFDGHKKPLVLNKGNAKTIAGRLGTDVEDWTGKTITLRESTTDFGGEEVPCVRVK